jgi:ABC-type glycerol-3-phosphate transport system substrate-binding protein
MKKRFLLLASFLLSVLLLSGCGGNKDEKAVAGKPLEVQINTNRVSSALTVLAENGGFNEEENIKVNLHVMNVAYADILSALTSDRLISPLGAWAPQHLCA